MEQQLYQWFCNWGNDVDNKVKALDAATLMLFGGAVELRSTMYPLISMVKARKEHFILQCSKTIKARTFWQK
eukprot:6867860-Ditylum_brightwellii.AAC.1